MRAIINDNNGQSAETTVPDNMPPSRLYRDQRIGAINQIAPHNMPDKVLEYVYDLHKVENGVAIYRYYGARQKA